MVIALKSSSYNSNIHNRRSIRLKDYNYAKAGLYFITICVQNRKPMFGKIEKGKMILNEYGTIAFDEWNKLPERFTNVEWDVFQIMPNHVHGIVCIGVDIVGATLAVAPGARVNRAPTNAVDRRGAGEPRPYGWSNRRRIQIVGCKWVFGNFQIRKQNHGKTMATQLL